MNDILQSLTYKYNTGEFYWNKTVSSKAVKGSLAGTVNSDGYRQIKYKGKNYLSHRLVMLMLSEISSGEQVDHINHDRLDNRLSNLRLVNNATNHKNKKLYNNNKTGVLGVGFIDRLSKWSVHISVNGKQSYQGVFSTLFDATCVRKSLELKGNYHPNHGSNQCHT